MDWNIIIAYAICGTLMSSAYIYSWCVLDNRTFDIKNQKNWLALIILVFVGIILNYFFKELFLLKMVGMMFLLFAVNYFLVTKKTENSVAAVIIIQALTMLSEGIISIVSPLFVGNYVDTLTTEYSGIIVVNIFVTILVLVFVKLKFVCKIYNSLVKTFRNMRVNHLFLSFIGFILIILTFMVVGYLKLPQSVVVMINSVLVIIYTVILFKYISTQNKLQKISNQYATSLTSLKEYEKIMNSYKVDNHENKNQLLIIRGMVNPENKKLIKYIDKLVGEKLTKSETAFYKAAKIPEGGLRAIIYSKISKMETLKINYELDIARDVKTTDLINIDEKIMVDICKIMGVFLDNAIEAVSDLENKEIIIEIYRIDNRLCVEISNDYTGNLDIERMDKAGHTTKGEGHGYGLTLVNKIVKSNACLENERTIDRNMFSQRLYINLNKK